jgi:predicted ATPase
MNYAKIKNFKCFHEVEIPLNKLTVLAGANGNGKSTVIQSLLFLRKTIEHCAKWEKDKFNYNEPNGLNVELNGSYCLDLGNSDYVIPVDSNIRDLVILGLFDEDNEFIVTYSTNTGQELWLTPKEVSNSYEDNPLCYQEFYYLNAERIGPRMSQSIKFYDYPNVGFKGEYTAQIIANLNWSFKPEDERVNKENLLGSRFEHYVNAWLEFILSGVSITSHFDDKTHTARIEMQNSYSKGSAVAPTNTGFGISYVLPIIVSGLIAKKNRFLIVENPEAHLHPSAQSKIGQFLATIANVGVNVVVETHSDHVINGIQIAVAEKKIGQENVSINFFQQDDKDAQPTVNTIGIKEKGELTSWPKGFFDQTQIDYSRLIQLRKNV